MGKRARRRKRRRPYQRVMFDDYPVHSHQHAAAVVGEFFEYLTAKLFGGWRVQVEDSSGYNPDIETHEGNEIEAKGSARSRWLIAQTQLDYLEKRKGSFFVLYRYPYSRESLISRFDSKQQIFNYLAANILSAYAISSSFVRQVMDEKLVEGMSRDTYVQVKHDILEDLCGGNSELMLKPKPKIYCDQVRHQQVMGVQVIPFNMFTIDDGTQPENTPPF